ncbi:hypothetical protein [Streptomyces sp. NPDC000410]
MPTIAGVSWAGGMAFAPFLLAVSRRFAATYLAGLHGAGNSLWSGR